VVRGAESGRLFFVKKFENIYFIPSYLRLGKLDVFLPMKETSFGLSLVLDVKAHGMRLKRLFFNTASRLKKNANKNTFAGCFDVLSLTHRLTSTHT